MDTQRDYEDDYANELEQEYRNEQSYFNSLSALPRDADGMVARYFKGLDCPDSTTADVVYIDRMTGEEVMRYDGADPANTRFDYGATPDADCFSQRGMNIKEKIRSEDAVISIQQCQNRMRQDDWGW